MKAISIISSFIRSKIAPNFFSILVHVALINAGSQDSVISKPRKLSQKVILMLEQEYQYFRSMDFFPVYNIVQPTMPFLSLQIILKFLCGTSRVRKCNELFLLTKPITIVINPKVLIQHFSHVTWFFN